MDRELQLMDEEEKEVFKLLKLNKYMEYNQAKDIVLQRYTKQKRLC